MKPKPTTSSVCVWCQRTRIPRPLGFCRSCAQVILHNLQVTREGFKPIEAPALGRRRAKKEAAGCRPATPAENQTYATN